jgi:FMN reductase
MIVTVVAGNPKPASKTLHAATMLAQELTGRAPDNVIDVIGLGGALLSFGDERVAEAVETVRRSTVAIVASPTFKASYSGLLKLFLDQFAGTTGMTGVLAVPLMMGAAPGHAMAPDLLLRPVLTELGATCAVPGLYVLDSTYRDGSLISEYARRWTPVVRALTAG